MEDRVSDAVAKMKSGYSCSQAVLSAFKDVAGMSEAEAMRLAAPFSGGAGIKCGAVLAAELAIKAQPNGDTLAAEIEKRFIDKNTSVICKELRGAGGRKLRSCIGCVEDAAEILNGLIEKK